MVAVVSIKMASCSSSSSSSSSGSSGGRSRGIKMERLRKLPS